MSIDLAELYRILARCVGTYQSVAFTPQDAATWLQHVDAQAARLAAQKPVVDAVLKLSTYSRETVDAGVRRIMQALGDYEDWLLEHPNV